MTGGRFTRAEIDEAFQRFQEVTEVAATTRNWDIWADLFTEDATYSEHHYGEFSGREEIRAWIKETMGTPPGSWMPAFPVEWYVVDEERDRIVCWLWNRMEDPGDGSIHQAGNITLLDYAGDGLWSREEDIYNPAKFAVMLGEWQAARDAASSTES